MARQKLEPQRTQRIIVFKKKKTRSTQRKNYGVELWEAL